MKNETVGLSHGCFDILGPGHIDHLTQAREKCDMLIVTISSDKVIRESKGKGRPVITEKDRATHLASLECVDYVAITQHPDAALVIRELKPTIYFKGVDTIARGPTTGFLNEQEECAKVGSKVIFTSSDSAYHTTDIIESIRGGE
jgi:D-beta-D-heptose 7-phosphate kinase/D-beta-D-heptose 1-phosphate adenosyltransferase